MSIRIFIITFLVLLSICVETLKFWEEWDNFLGILGLQMLMLATMHSYMYGKTMYLGIISLDPESEPIGRKIACGTAIAGYIFLFFK